MVKFRQFFLGGTAGFLLALSFLGVAATVSYFGAGSADQLGVSLATLISGEDQTNNVLRVEQQFSYCADKTADASCKASAGFVHSISCAGTDAAATAGDVALRDATSAGTGTIVKQIAFAAAFQQPFTLMINAPFSTGIYLDFTTTADVACEVSYR